MWDAECGVRSVEGRVWSAGGCWGTGGWLLYRLCFGSTLTFSHPTTPHRPPLYRTPFTLHPLSPYPVSLYPLPPPPSTAVLIKG